MCVIWDGRRIDKRPGDNRMLVMSIWVSGEQYINLLIAASRGDKR